MLIAGMIIATGTGSRLPKAFYRIAYNAAMSLFAKVKPGRFEQLSDSLPTKEAANQFGMQDALYKALNTVSGEERFLLIASVLDGISFEELSAITGVASGTLRVRLHRLKAELAKEIEKFEKQ